MFCRDNKESVPCFDGMVETKIGEGNLEQLERSGNLKVF
jgi:hypothetical protein